LTTELSCIQELSKFASYSMYIQPRYVVKKIPVAITQVEIRRKQTWHYVLTSYQHDWRTSDMIWRTCWAWMVTNIASEIRSSVWVDGHEASLLVSNGIGYDFVARQADLQSPGCSCTPTSPMWTKPQSSQQHKNFLELTSNEAWIDSCGQEGNPQLSALQKTYCWATMLADRGELCPRSHNLHRLRSWQDELVQYKGGLSSIVQARDRAGACEENRPSLRRRSHVKFWDGGPLMFLARCDQRGRASLIVARHDGSRTRAQTLERQRYLHPNRGE